MMARGIFFFILGVDVCVWMVWIFDGACLVLGGFVCIGGCEMRILVSFGRMMSVVLFESWEPGQGKEKRSVPLLGCEESAFLK